MGDHHPLNPPRDPTNRPITDQLASTGNQLEAAHPRSSTNQRPCLVTIRPIRGRREKAINLSRTNMVSRAGGLTSHLQTHNQLPNSVMGPNTPFPPFPSVFYPSVNGEPLIHQGADQACSLPHPTSVKNTLKAIKKKWKQIY